MTYFLKLLFFVIGLTSFSLYSQVYVVEYQYFQKMEMDENLRRSYPPEILEQINEASNRTYDFKLITSENESIISLQPKISNAQTTSSVEIEPDLKWVYKNLKDDYFVNLIELDKKYYIKDSLENIKWTETTEIKDILSYSAKKFFHENENQFIEIWQAENIKIPNGPMNFGGNENLILEVTVKNKLGGLNWNYKASSVSKLNDYNFASEIPKSTISKKDFDEIYSKFQQKSKEMREEMDKD